MKVKIQHALAAFKLIGDLKSLVVLALACREAYNTRILARKGTKVTGVDFEKLMRSAKQNRKIWRTRPRQSFNLLSVFGACILKLNVGLEIMIYEKILERRTIRKFTKESIPKDVLEKCVNAARLSPSGMNRQPLKYVIVNDEKLLREVFSATSWAGYLPDYGPSKEEMPRAYIIVLLDREIRKNCGHDAGIAVMSISMVAHVEGLGSCILGAIDRSKLRRATNIPDNLEIVLAVALGYPAEKPVLDKVRNGDIKYWLDNDNVLHVPKREFKDIVKWNEESLHS